MASRALPPSQPRPSRAGSPGPGPAKPATPLSRRPTRTWSRQASHAPLAQAHPDLVPLPDASSPASSPAAPRPWRALPPALADLHAAAACAVGGAPAALSRVVEFPAQV